MSKFKYVWVNDNTAEIYLDEMYIGELSHELFGWSGMKHASQILYNIADLLDFELEVVGEPAI